MRSTNKLKILSNPQPVPALLWKPIPLEDWSTHMAKAPSYKEDPLWSVIGIGSGGRISNWQIDKIVYPIPRSRKKS